MRAGASGRRILTGLGVAAALALLGGCSSPIKRSYLHHLSITVPPAPPDSKIVALFAEERGVDRRPTVTVAGAESDGTR